MALYPLEPIYRKGSRKIKVKNTLKRWFIPGQYGFTLTLGKWSVFLGFLIQEIVVYPVRNKPKRVTKTGSAEFFPFP